jgi:hypothetical protein
MRLAMDKIRAALGRDLMAAHPGRDDLVAFALGALDPEERRVWRARPGMRELLEELEALAPAVGVLGESVEQLVPRPRCESGPGDREQQAEAREEPRGSPDGGSAATSAASCCDPRPGSRRWRFSPPDRRLPDRR